MSWASDKIYSERLFCVCENACVLQVLILFRHFVGNLVFIGQNHFSKYFIVMRRVYYNENLFKRQSMLTSFYQRKKNKHVDVSVSRLQIENMVLKIKHKSASFDEICLVTLIRVGGAKIKGNENAD